ncbi:preprotein translocase subunit SecF/SecD/SecF fusion protein [Ammoniphilus resinae]|uniref:Protein-export membrane protein SecF n=1 Tax=Ammoniphilus resinae TaxID=861532 RepID=A0ABS4GJL9_9BACL|nr:preprotein translocase subunit SecF/SecD/SecF fusion protein [Ammoniphilus resinae]
MNFNPKTWNYVSHRKQFFLLSGVLQIIGILGLLFLGFNLGVDFQSGTRLDIAIGKPFTEAEVAAELKQLNLEPGSIVTAGDNGERAAVRFTEPLNKEQIASVKNSFTKKYGDQVDIQESTVDPVVSRELAKNAMYALIWASIGIVIYVTVRFEYRFAIAGIIALLHDAIGVISIFSIFQIEVDLPFIAAILTIVGYSINDTIVTFDRIRENMKLHKVKRKADLEYVVNLSIQETITRSINTVITVLMASAALLIFGGESIRTFSLALTIGLFIGMYSSIFIASQIWLEWKAKEFAGNRITPTNNEAS